MKRWRKIVIYTLVLALLISLWTSIAMATHCQSSENTSHSMHTQMGDSDVHAHMHDQAPSQDLNNNSDCDCGCNGNLDCSVSGCSVTALSNSIKFDLTYLTQTIYQQAQTFTKPLDPNLLFRPPITLS